MVRILSGVVHIGTHSIVHRDLKLDNVMLHGPNVSVEYQPGKVGQRPACVKIIDFGCAVDCSVDPEDGLRLRYPGRYISKGGAPYYLPPEIQTAKPGRGKVLDYSKSDVWSAGLIAHTMLSPDQDAFADKDPLRNYNDLPPCYSAQIRGIVQRMLNVELGDRLTAEDAHAEMCGARAQLAEAGAE